MIVVKICRVLLLATTVFATSLFGQEAKPDSAKPAWESEIIGNLNLTQARFDNWEQGGENTLAWQLKLDSKFVRDAPKYNWSNSGKFTLGYAKVGDTEARKSSDEISLESVYTRKLSKLLNPFVAVSAKTQFVTGFQYSGDTKTKVSRFLDPGYFTQSLGVGYASSENFKSRLGATIKETVTSEFPVPYADDPKTAKIEKTRVEPGISSVTDFKRKLQENITLTSKLDLFSDLEAFNRIDVLWENDLLMRVSKLISVTIELNLLYDRDVSTRRQLSQTLAVGLTYSFL